MVELKLAESPRARKIAIQARFDPTRVPNDPKLCPHHCILSSAVTDAGTTFTVVAFWGDKALNRTTGLELKQLIFDVLLNFIAGDYGPRGFQALSELPLTVASGRELNEVVGFNISDTATLRASADRVYDVSDNRITFIADFTDFGKKLDSLSNVVLQELNRFCKR
ncbi:hypothetical protein HDU87_003390 [Geranomyces variabilis]|uniref:Uncharacterized protein n=1 Tax=Geranomyces variabilis TaxID=109894 RepID=A0AAD5TB52_9FUNG|nr:hypothetical protein HDU87_003390 [Geranomyces variabilis]